MSTAATMGRFVEASPRLKARLAGVFYLLTGLVAFDEFFVLGRLVVHDDPAATGANILAHQMLFRLGFAAEIIASACNIPLAVIFFDLFRVVSRRVSLLVVFFMLMGTAIETVALLNRFAPLIILKGGNYLSAFTAEQLQGAAYTSLQLYEFGFTIALVFFGFYCLSLGYLVFRSAFLPRIIGVLLVGGLSYLTSNFANFLSPGVCGPSVPVCSGLPRPRGRIANTVASRDGRERSAMEGAGQGIGASIRR
jgi:hypothetical protein